MVRQILTRKIGRIVQAAPGITPINRTSLKIGRLVHVNPQTIKADILVETLNLCSPVDGCIWMKEVWIDGQVWPDSAHKQTTAQVPHKHIHFQSHVIRCI